MLQIRHIQSGALQNAEEECLYFFFLLNSLYADERVRNGVVSSVSMALIWWFGHDDDILSSLKLDHVQFLFCLLSFLASKLLLGFLFVSVVEWSQICWLNIRVGQRIPTLNCNPQVFSLRWDIERFVLFCFESKDGHVFCFFLIHFYAPQFLFFAFGIIFHINI